ncbi:LOW QUALITY PROTEIN: hypothetical protein CRUP_011153, partial [Coryphaenoides rupestris]
RLRKAVIPNLQPDTSYDFKITSPEGNMGGLRHRINAKTSPPITIRRPETSVLLTWEFPESTYPYRFTPDTSYDFKITSPEGNMGGLRHRINAKTSPPITIRRPEVDHTRDSEPTVTIILPSLETRTPIRRTLVFVAKLTEKFLGTPVKPREAREDGMLGRSEEEEEVGKEKEKQQQQQQELLRAGHRSGGGGASHRHRQRHPRGPAWLGGLSGVRRDGPVAVLRGGGPPGEPEGAARGADRVPDLGVARGRGLGDPDLPARFVPGARPAPGGEGEDVGGARQQATLRCVVGVPGGEIQHRRVQGAVLWAEAQAVAQDLRRAGVLGGGAGLRGSRWWGRPPSHHRGADNHFLSGDDIDNRNIKLNSSNNNNNNNNK